MGRENIWFNQGEQQLDEEVDEVKKSARKTGKKLKTINTGMNKKSKVINPKGFLGW